MVDLVVPQPMDSRRIQPLFSLERLHVDNHEALAELSLLMRDYPNNQKRIRHLIEDWDYASDSSSPFIRAIAARDMFSQSDLCNLFRITLRDATISHAFDLIDTFSNDPMLVPLFIERLEGSIRPLYGAELLRVLQYIELQYPMRPDADPLTGVDNLRDALLSRLAMLEDPAPIPNHMIPTGGGVPLRHIEGDDFLRLNIDGEEIVRVDAVKVASLIDDRELFRVFGPVNTFAGEKFEELDVGNKYGGSRMFLDLTYREPLKDLNSEFPGGGGWFVGSCQRCTRRISNYRAAVRRPISSGGWRGCYCGWYCASKAIIELSKDRGMAIDLAAKDMEMALLRLYSSQASKYGIYDILPLGTDDRVIKELHDSAGDISYEAPIGRGVKIAGELFYLPSGDDGCK